MIFNLNVFDVRFAITVYTSSYGYRGVGSWLNDRERVGPATLLLTTILIVP